jgi:hypothetical protein
MKTVDLYQPISKQYPFLKNNVPGVDNISRPMLFAEQIDQTLKFWSAFFKEYGWDKLDQCINDLHFAFYGAEPDGMDPTVSRSTLLGDLSAKAGVALALGHCVEEIFNEKSLPLFVNTTLTGRTVLFCHQITVDACQAFHIDHQTIDFKKNLPGLLYIICETRGKNGAGDYFLEACVQAFDKTFEYLDEMITREGDAHGSRQKFLAKVYSDQYGMRSEGRWSGETRAWRDVVNAHSSLLQQMHPSDRHAILAHCPFTPTEVRDSLHRFKEYEFFNYSAEDAHHFGVMLTTAPGHHFQSQFIDALLKRMERMTADDNWCPLRFAEFMRALNETAFPLTEWLCAAIHDPDMRHQPQRTFDVSMLDKHVAIKDLIREYLFFCKNDSPRSFNMTQETKRILLESAIRMQNVQDIDHVLTALPKTADLDAIYAAIDLVVGNGYFASKVKKPGLLRDNLSTQLGL